VTNYQGVHEMEHRFTRRAGRIPYSHKNEEEHA
jgi:hypothetical protein